MASDIHFGGLVSGVDVQGIVDKMLEIEVERIEKVQTEKAETQADVAAWSDISGSMTTLTDSLDTLRGLDLWGQMTATASDTTKLSATATSSAVPASYDITISQLAQAHSIASDKASTLTGIPGDDADTDLVAAGVLTAGETFTIEGQVITIASDESLNSLADQINTAADSMADADKLSASIIDNTLVITRQNTGDTDITLSDTTGTPLIDIGVLIQDTITAPKNELIESQDAEFTVNGIGVTRSSNTGLSDVITGVTLNLLDEASVSDNVTLTIGNDTAAVKTAIQDLVTSYNAATAKMEAYIDIDLTDPKTPVVGTLQGDSMVTEILFRLRKLVNEQKSVFDSDNAAYTYDGRTGVADSLEDAGVWTAGTDNRLALADEDKLDYMLANYFDEMEQLFRGIDSGDGYEDGVAEDLYDYSYSMSTSMTGQIAKHLFALNDDVSDLDERMEKMYDDLDRYEMRLWRDFGAMEDAISRMQQELAWLTGQLGMS